MFVYQRVGWKYVRTGGLAIKLENKDGSLVTFFLMRKTTRLNHWEYLYGSMKYPLESIRNCIAKKNRASSNFWTFIQLRSYVCPFLQVVNKKHKQNKTAWFCSGYKSETPSVFDVFRYKACHMVCGFSLWKGVWFAISWNLRDLAHVMWLLDLTYPTLKSPSKEGKWTVEWTKRQTGLLG